MRTSFFFAAGLGLVATLPAAVQASTTCTTSVVCGEYINTYSGSSGGVAIHGEANGGIGVRGTSVANTGFYGASGSGNSATPGVEGESTTNTGMDAGAGFGLAYLAGKPAPEYGAIGYGLAAGIFGETAAPGTSSSVGAGVSGSDTAAGAYNFGVQGTSANGIGGLFEGGGKPAGELNPYYGEFPFGILAIAEPTANSPYAYAIVAESSSYPLVVENTQVASSLTFADSVYLITATTLNGNDAYFDVLNNGNAYVSGSLQTKNGTYLRTGGSGTTRLAYGAETTRPQIEDAGEGLLASGHAVIAIDPALADSIDMRRGYHVFLTPEGDCNGLYVSQKTPGSFEVRELRGGRSSLAFEYRILAKPLDESGERLARVPARPDLPPPLPAGRLGKRAPVVLTPEARLKQRLGAKGYADLIAEISRRIAGR